MATREQWKQARINSATPGEDKRVKLTEAQRARIHELYVLGTHSQRELAREYGVSRKLVQLIISPERLARHKALYRARRKDGRYYIKEKHTQAMRRHRENLRAVNPELNNGNSRVRQIKN
jgi:transposase-like protein